MVIRRKEELMTKEEYLTGSDVSNYYITTAYLQDTSEMILSDLAYRIQEEFRRRGDQITTKTKEIITDPAVESPVPKPIERGTELIPVGRLETQDAYLLDILKEQGFYLMYNKRETKFGELEYWQVLYPKED